ncbi:MAG: DUF2461 domain-containing protein [Caldilineaceae bacterium]
MNTINLGLTLNFLNELRDNNNKAWFEQNRARYEQAKTSFEQFIAQLIAGLSASDDMTEVAAKDCIFRINRDVRFSKDKSPYKTGMGANIAPGGKKSNKLGYYLHLEPNGASMAAGGLYMPTGEQIGKFRQAIDRKSEVFKAIIAAPAFVHAFGTVTGDKLATAPQGYSRAHPEIDLLKLKQIIVMHHFTDEEVAAPVFAAQVLDVFRAMKPFLDYLNRIIE